MAEKSPIPSGPAIISQLKGITNGKVQMHSHTLMCYMKANKKIYMKVIWKHIKNHTVWLL